MENLSNIANGWVPDPATQVFFAIVCDNEVVSYIAFPQESEMNLAIYRSNPIFIEVPHTKMPQIGSIWDGKEFKEQVW